MPCIILTLENGPRGKGYEKKVSFPPEGDTIDNAITRKCKLGMLTYITMDISVCLSEWYHSAKFRVLAYALRGKFEHCLGGGGAHLNGFFAPRGGNLTEVNLQKLKCPGDCPGGMLNFPLLSLCF